MVNVGTKIYDFTLRDQHGRKFTLSAQLGRKVLLSFHPLAWTGVCGRQMKTLEDNRAAFEAKNTVAVGISVDSSFAKAPWAKELGIEHTPLLADFWPHGGVAIALGIFRGNEGSSERANIIIDEQGVVSFARVYPSSELPDIAEVLAAL